MSEPVTLNLTDDDGAVTLDLIDVGVALDAGNAETIVLDLDDSPTDVTLDLDTAAENVALTFTTETVTLALVDMVTVNLDATGPETVTLEVGPATGPMGPAGPKGDPGPPGPAGQGSSYVHSQAVADDVWTVVHTVPYMPAVTVVDSAGTVLYADVIYVDAQTVEITHSWPTAGFAYLS